MRTIGKLDSEEKARRFRDFLIVQRIPNEVEADGTGWDIWVRSDDDLAKASEWLLSFKANPDDKQFNATPEADSVAVDDEKSLKEFQKNIRDNLLRRLLDFRFGPLTAWLVLGCIYFFFKTNGAKELTGVADLLFSEQAAKGTAAERMLASPEIRSGEFWRLISPILLHGGWVHILFNLIFFRFLGAMIETRESPGRLLGLVLISGVFSNWAQYVLSGSPWFIGVSGVVYALLGYVWMKGRYQPELGLFLDKDVWIFMLGWLVMCFSGLFESVIGKMANWLHLGGLVIGMAWGYIATRNTVRGKI